MTIDRRQFVSGAALGAAALATPSLLRAQSAPIKIGEINSYTAQPAFLKPYRQGWELALEQVNA
jgi:branched-chain amino acid transport system substrate-binding protein